jgi:hypothetical protein
VKVEKSPLVSVGAAWAEKANAMPADSDRVATICFKA